MPLTLLCRLDWSSPGPNPKPTVELDEVPGSISLLGLGGEGSQQTVSEALISRLSVSKVQALEGLSQCIGYRHRDHFLGDALTKYSGPYMT